MNTHRKLTTLFTALLILAASAASAEIYTQAPERIREVPDYGPPYLPVEVEIWTNRGDGARYCAGESIEVFFRTNADAWVAIYNVDTRGRVDRLFPSRHARDNFVRGGVVHRLPSRYGHHFEVEGPSGWETLRAVASTDRHALRSVKWDGGTWHQERYGDDGRYDRRRPDRYRATTMPVTRAPAPAPERIREVPDYPRDHPRDHPRDYPEVSVDETRHYVRDGYRCRVPRPRPNRPWWHRH